LEIEDINGEERAWGKEKESIIRRNKRKERRKKPEHPSTTSTRA
jgi:hypothetical protein